MSDIARRIANLSPEQRALLEKRLKGPAAPTPANEPIAIIGMGCRFPGADSPEAFWRMLRDGVDAIREVPRDRWDVDALFDPDPSAPGKIAARVGGFLDDVDRFDAAFFEISPREAVRMDPQQRLLLEVACDALEEGGQTRERLAGSATAVFVGVHSHASDYLWLQYLEPEDMDAFTGTGTAHNLLAGRLSYLFDLHGPAVVVDTACSSSLVAAHLAVQSLRSRESDLAVAAGVNLILTPHFTIAASRMHMLAPDGRCKAFDRRADGFVRGEGCGAVVLKRLSDALRDGDPVVAVIRGSATNQDGHTNGITAPNGLAQRAVVEHALKDAGVAPEDVGYVEAHGTGTALGDPIEIEALSAGVGRPRADGVPCVVGSVKTNVGHLEGGAGVAGLMKAALILKHGEIPPNLHFTGLNPHIDVAGTRFEFPTELRPWRGGGTRRLAGVSAFGWSGTNAHMVLEEAPEAASRPGPGEASWLLLPISARSDAALTALARSYRDRLVAADGRETSDVCFTAALRRSHHDHRVAFVGRSAGDLVSALDGALAAGIAARRGEAPPRVVFVFPGQGSQWLGMGRTLLRDEPAFKEAIARCDAAIRAEAGWSLVAELEASPEASRLHEIDVVQPTLFAVEVALAETWRAWGIVPEAVVGHSMGEVAAAHVAGVLSLADAARVICRRSRLLRRIAGRGAMAVVELSVEEAREALAGFEDRLSIAVSNGPRSTVISGDPAALERVLETLSKREVFCRPVKVDVASHSPQVDELRSALMGELAGLVPGPATVPIYSTVTASVRTGEGFDAEYWVRNLREPVRFFDALRGLLGDGHDAFVEMSPHPILLPAVDDAIAHEQREAITLPSLRREEDEQGVLRASAASLYAWGATLDWKRLVPGGGASVALPRYPWQRERYWLEGAGGEEARPALRGSPEHPFLGVRVEAADRPDVWLWESVWGPNAPACRYDHELQGMHVFAAAGYVDLALTAAAVAFGATADALSSLELLEPLRLPQGGERLRVQVVLSRAEEPPLLQVFSRAQGRWVRHARASLGAVAAAAAASSLDESRKRCPTEMTGDAYYARLAELGVGVREELLGLRRLWAGERELVAECEAPSGAAGSLGVSVPAALLDAAFQMAAVSPRSVASPQSGLDLHMPMCVEAARLGRIKDTRWIVVSWPEGGQPGGDSVRRQVLFFDSEGREIGAIGGVELRRLEVGVPEADPSAWVQRLEWKALARHGQPATAGGAEGRWVVLADQGGVGDALATALEAKGGTPVVVTASDTCGRLAPNRWRVRPAHREDLASLLQAVGDDGALVRGVVHLWSLDGKKGKDLSEADLLAAQQLGCESMVLLLQELGRRSLEPSPRVFGVTSGAQAVGAGEDPTVAAAPLWGLGRVAAEEHPELWGGMIDLDPAAAAGDSARLLVEEITAPSEESDVALRRGARHVLRLAPLSEAIASRPVAFRPDASYLVTGGLGGLGLEVARSMAAQGARHLVLVGRTGLPPRERWDADLPERLRVAVSVVTEIERAGVAVRVASVDVGDAASVGALLDDLRRAGAPPLRGVVHTAGTIDDRLIADLDRESLHRVLRPKLLGGFVLDQALEGEALDFFVLFSSLGSLLGPPGQGSYAAANAFLDALAQHRRARGRPVLSVNWGAWAGKGFAATEGGARTTKALEAQGISSFHPAAALDLLGRLMAGAPAQVAVLPLDPAKFLASGRRVPPLLADLVHAPRSAVATPSTAGVRRQILGMAAGERGPFLEAHLQEQVASVLKLPVAKVEPHRPLGSLGLESLTALELRKRLEATLGLRLSATIVWSYPTVTALAQHLATRLGADSAAPRPQAPRPVETAPAGPALAAVERLSEEEALRELLGGKGKGA